MFGSPLEADDIRLPAISLILYYTSPMIQLQETLPDLAGTDRSNRQDIRERIALNTVPLAAIAIVILA